MSPRKSASLDLRVWFPLVTVSLLCVAFSALADGPCNCNNGKPCLANQAYFGYYPTIWRQWPGNCGELQNGAATPGAQQRMPLTEPPAPKNEFETRSFIPEGAAGESSGNPGGASSGAAGVAPTNPGIPGSGAQPDRVGPGMTNPPRPANPPFGTPSKDNTPKFNLVIPPTSPEAFAPVRGVNGVAAGHYPRIAPQAEPIGTSEIAGPPSATIARFDVMSNEPASIPPVRPRALVPTAAGMGPIEIPVDGMPSAIFPPPVNSAVNSAGSSASAAAKLPTDLAPELKMELQISAPVARQPQVSEANFSYDAPGANGDLNPPRHVAPTSQPKEHGSPKTSADQAGFTQFGAAPAGLPRIGLPPTDLPPIGLLKTAPTTTTTADRDNRSLPEPQKNRFELIDLPPVAPSAANRAQPIAAPIAVNATGANNPLAIGRNKNSSSGGSLTVANPWAANASARQTNAQVLSANAQVLQANTPANLPPFAGARSNAQPAPIAASKPAPAQSKIPGRIAAPIIVEEIGLPRIAAINPLTIDEVNAAEPASMRLPSENGLSGGKAHAGEVLDTQDAAPFDQGAFNSNSGGANRSTADANVSQACYLERHPSGEVNGLVRVDPLELSRTLTNPSVPQADAHQMQATGPARSLFGAAQNRAAQYATSQYPGMQSGTPQLNAVPSGASYAAQPNYRQPYPALPQNRALSQIAADEGVMASDLPSPGSGYSQPARPTNLPAARAQLGFDSSPPAGNPRIDNQGIGRPQTGNAPAATLPSAAPPAARPAAPSTDSAGNPLRAADDPGSQNVNTLVSTGMLTPVEALSGSQRNPLR